MSADTMYVLAFKSGLGYNLSFKSYKELKRLYADNRDASGERLRESKIDFRVKRQNEILIK